VQEVVEAVAVKALVRLVILVEEAVVVRFLECHSLLNRWAKL